MNNFYLIILFLNISFSQSILERSIVPLYIKSEFSYGYDDNYLKLSQPEKNSDLEYRMGDSKQVNSNIIKNKFNILYMPYIFNNHETKFDFTISASKYSSSTLKSYNNYYIRVAQHLAPYTWAKFSYSYTPSFYIKSYLQSDPYILYNFKEDNYMPSLFNSEKMSFELAAPILYLNRIYFSIKYVTESQYYNTNFTEFDLEITSYYLKIRKKIFGNLNLSLAYMHSTADNISYRNGLLSTKNKDRSYTQYKIYSSFSVQNFYFLGRKISSGFYSVYERREFSSSLETDKLHFKRTHDDLAINYWLKRHLNNNFDIKFKAASRFRNTFSPYNTEGITVSRFKTFEKFEIWLSIIFKMELNVY